MKIKMNPADREFIYEYNYPETHAQLLMYGIHEVIYKEGCYKIQIDDQFYFLSEYDMHIVDQLPEDLFKI